MPNIKYKVVFKGAVAEGFELEQVKRNLQASFKYDEATIAKLFSGQAVTIKRNLDLETAKKYAAAFAKVGALCEIVKKSPSVQSDFLDMNSSGLSLASDQSTEKPASTNNVSSPFAPQASNEFACPKCGFQQSRTQSCGQCGIIFDKYYQQQSGLGTQETVSSQSNAHYRTQRTGRGKSQHPGLIKELFSVYVESLFKGQIKLAVFVLLIFPIFGGALVISAIFYTRDHHIIYSFNRVKLGCFSDKSLSKHVRSKMYKAFVTEYYFSNHFEDRETIKKAEEVELQLDEYCLYGYHISIGNIGDEEVGSIALTFQPDMINLITLDQRTVQRMKHEMYTIVATAEEMKEPDFTYAKNSVLQIKRIEPNVLAEIKVIGMHKRNEKPVELEEALMSATISDGTIEYGDPRITGFTRFIANIF